MAQSLKQKWVSERLFINNGSLKGVAARLRQIANSPSTLPVEANLISYAAGIIYEINLKLNQEESFEQFKKRRG